MRTNLYNTPSEFINSWTSNKEYFDMLSLMASLSNLFSESNVPFLDYRLAENLFCKYFNAINDARSCTAYDARIGNLGIGVKTFILPKECSTEKIAEFNKLKPTLEGLKGIALARKLSQYRNERMEYANQLFGIEESLYHIVGRKDGRLLVFNTDYSPIDIDNIQKVKDNSSSLSFWVGDDFYSFNKSKSVLMKKFTLPTQYKEVDVDIIDDPLELLSQLLSKQDIGITSTGTSKVKGVDYVILPLYSLKGKHKMVPERSGLNQWNARGRARNENEVYIPIPHKIHDYYPDFFPTRDEPFILVLPDGKTLSAKICQDGGKALMSNPNSALGEWVLRKVLKKPVGEIVTMDDLNALGIDSVYIEKTKDVDKDGQKIYKFIFTSSEYESYDAFIAQNE